MDTDNQDHQPTMPPIIQILLAFPTPEQMRLQVNHVNVPGGWPVVARALLKSYELALREVIAAEQAENGRLDQSQILLPSAWDRRQ